MSQTRAIGADTRLYGVIGMPVRHSLSPAMHNAAFASLGIDACYLAFEVAPKDLELALAGARKMGVGGLSITVPHKVAALGFAAEVDETARLSGAANTLVPHKNGWKAYNTDASGFVKALGEELDFKPRGKRIAIFGAGGAARAAIVGLAAADSGEIIVAARDFTSAQMLAADFSGKVPVSVEATQLDELPQRLEPGDLLVSATPLGLDPAGRWPWPVERLSSGVLIYDMAYAAGQTCLEAQAIGAGLKASSGRAMLLHQGAEAFHLWTGMEPPLERMRNALQCLAP